jgi:outer membrane cobalamin receptor
MLDGFPTHTRGAAAPPGFFSGSAEACDRAGLACGRCGLWLPMTAMALLACVPAAGAAGTGEEAPVATIVVTAEPPAATESRAPTAFATEIPAEPHAEQVETLADALAESVGVQVRRFGGLGAFSTVSIRGSSSNQVQLYLDGVPLSRARDETVNLSDLPLDSLDHIEVYRGTVPVGFAGGGIGGVVNLVTKPPSATPTTDLAVSYGSFDTRKVTASHSRRVGGVDLLGFVTYLGSQGDFEFLDDNGTPQNPLDDRRTKRRNNAFDSVDALLKAGYTFAGGLRVDLTSETFYKDQGVPGIGSFQSPTASLTQYRALNYLRFERNGLLDGDLDASANLFGVFERQEFTDLGSNGRPTADLGGIRQDRQDDTTLFGADTTARFYRLPKQVLSGFAELSHETFAGSNAAATNAPRNEPDQTRFHATAALQDEIDPLGGRLLVVPTVRYEHLRDDLAATQPDLPAVGSAGTVDHDLWSPSIGAEWRLLSPLSLKGNFGRFQRAPSFSELFGNRGTVRGNPNLKPETGLNFDAGLVARWNGPSWLDELRLQYAYFASDVDDAIVLVQTSPTVFTPRNVGGARIRGHELVLHGGVLRHLGLDLNYTHQDAEDRSDSPLLRGKQLPGRPQNELYTRLELFGPPGRLFYEFNFVSGNFTDAANFNEVPSRDVHTIGFTAYPLDWLAVTFEARNLTDNQISDVGGFPLPGRSFFGTVKLHF